MSKRCGCGRNGRTSTSSSPGKAARHSPPTCLCRARQTGINVYGTTLGYSKTLRVTPETCYHFKNPPTQTHDRLTVTEGTVNRCEANLPAPRARQAGYTMTLTSTNLQGWITVSGEIEPSNECGSCGTGGGGNPQQQDYTVNVTQRVAWAYFTLPANGTNLTCCAGSTNTVEAKVVLGDAGVPSAGTVNFSLSPTSLGSLGPTSVLLSASGSATTTFVASSDSGSGTLTATGQNLKDEQNASVPNVSAELTVKKIKIVQTPSELLWFGGENAANFYEQVTLAAEGVTIGTFKWEVIQGADKVDLNSGGADADTITVTDHNTILVKSTGASDPAEEVTKDVTICLTVYTR